MAEPQRRPLTRKFHIIQLVVVNQKNLSSGPRSTCNESFLRCSRRMPPWPWTMALGSPVVPEEYKTHSGWSNGTCSKESSAPLCPISSSSQRTTFSRPLVSGSSVRYGKKTVFSREGISPCRLATISVRS